MRKTGKLTHEAIPDLTIRRNELIDRLRHVPAGVFTVDELSDILARMNNDDGLETTSWRVYRSFEGIPQERDPGAEAEEIDYLEQLAVKAGV